MIKANCKSIRFLGLSIGASIVLTKPFTFLQILLFMNIGILKADFKLTFKRQSAPWRTPRSLLLAKAVRGYCHKNSGLNGPRYFLSRTKRPGPNYGWLSPTILNRSLTYFVARTLRWTWFHLLVFKSNCLASAHTLPTGIEIQDKFYPFLDQKRQKSHALGVTYNIWAYIKILRRSNDLPGYNPTVGTLQIHLHDLKGYLSIG